MGFTTHDLNYYSEPGIGFGCRKSAHFGWWPKPDACEAFCAGANLNGLWGVRNISGVYWYEEVHIPLQEQNFNVIATYRRPT